MDFGEVVDCGNTLSHLVRRIGRIEMIGKSLVKIGWVDYSRAFPRPRLVVSTMMDLDELLASRAGFSEMFARASMEASGAASPAYLKSMVRH